MKIGFTGTRNGMTLSQRERLIWILNDQGQEFGEEVDEFHHGDCKGSDHQAFRIADELAWVTVAHPCNIRSWRAFTNSTKILDPLPPLVRNKIIVDSVGLMIATPEGRAEVLRSGTWSTIRRARKLPRRLWIIYPDGELVRENP